MKGEVTISNHFEVVRDLTQQRDALRDCLRMLRMSADFHQRNIIDKYLPPGDDSWRSDAEAEAFTIAATGGFDPDELLRYAEMYGHPEEWVKKAQQLHAENERLRERLECGS